MRYLIDKVDQFLSFGHLIEDGSGKSPAFPLTHFDELFHVGSMKPSDKGMGSYEGSGLSVSLHPAEWREIARGIVSGETWLMTKAGNHFLDFHAMDETQREGILKWGHSLDLCEDTTTYSVTYFDDDLDDEVTQTFDSREEAEAERDFFEWDHPIVEKPGEMRSTPKLDRKTRQNHPSVGSRAVLELLAPLFADHVLGIDGVWWEDELSPETLSAPRGVIVPGKVSTWYIEKLTPQP